jgi:hypothetical protein
VNTSSVSGIDDGCREKHSAWQDINIAPLNVKKIPPAAVLSLAGQSKLLG